MKKRRNPIPFKRSLSYSPPPVIKPAVSGTKTTTVTASRTCLSTSLQPSPLDRPVPNLPQGPQAMSPPDASEMKRKSFIIATPTPSLSGSCRSSVKSSDKEVSLPQNVVLKMCRSMTAKKKEFFKLRKNLIQIQDNVLEHYAILRDMESLAGVTSDDIGDVRVVSVTGWPAHDLLLLVRADFSRILESDITGVFGPQVLQQLHAQLNPIPDELLAITSQLLTRRVKTRNSADTKSKNAEIDQETEKLRRIVDDTVENLKAKINYSLELAKIPWVDRDTFKKKMDRLQKENIFLQHKLNNQPKKETHAEQKEVATTPVNNQLVAPELAKERAARDALKDVVSTAEGMLRVARVRIATLERQLKDSKAEIDTWRRKHKELEQLYRSRENTFDARSKKLMEVSKTGEQAKEALSRQRDALELRVKELREQAEAAEKIAEQREAEQKARAEALEAKVAEQEKRKVAAEARIGDMEGRIKEMEELLRNLRERSAKLVDMERRRCLEYLPSKENEPSDRETEIWKELQTTKLALSKAEEELRLSRDDKDNFLNCLAKIAQGADSDSIQNQISTKLLDREQKIAKLQHIVEEQKENEKLMEQTMTQYENNLASLRLEVMRLKNYDCYSKEVPSQDLHTELMDMIMQVETLKRERAALITAAASRALMLERHERAADLFATVTRARRDLKALLDGHPEPPPLKESLTKMSHSMTLMSAASADTWTALRTERARVLRLESAVLAQSLQLEREGRVRTHLERRRALLERQLRAHASTADRNRPIHENISFFDA